MMDLGVLEDCDMLEETSDTSELDEDQDSSLDHDNATAEKKASVDTVSQKAKRGIAEKKNVGLRFVDTSSDETAPRTTARNKEWNDF
ncbi:hypothetical protein ACOMHN_006400 [Nucella lapillus]